MEVQLKKKNKNQGSYNTNYQVFGQKWLIIHNLYSIPKKLTIFYRFNRGIN